MEEPRSLRASLGLATSLSMLWLPVFLSPNLHEEGDSSLGSSALLKRLDNYRGRKRREKSSGGLVRSALLLFPTWSSSVEQPRMYWNRARQAAALCLLTWQMLVLPRALPSEASSELPSLVLLPTNLLRERKEPLCCPCEPAPPRSTSRLRFSDSSPLDWLGP